MSKLFHYPFYVFLLAVFFCIHGVNENYGAITFSEVFETGLWVFLFLSTLFAFGFFVCKSKYSAGFFSFFFGIFYLFFGAIKEFLANFPLLASYKVLLPTFLFFIFFVLRLSKKYPKNNLKFTRFLNILFIVYCSYDFVVFGYKIFNEKSTNSISDFSVSYKVISDKPNIYYLLFDEYAGYKSLNDSLNFKNDSLFNNLKSKEFVFIPTFSNYFFNLLVCLLSLICNI